MSITPLFQSGANIAMKVPAAALKATVAFFVPTHSDFFLQVGTGSDSVF
jgi:hypothetical protein